MKYFYDKTGKQWEIVIDVKTLKRVDALCGIKLLSLVDFEEKNGEINNELLMKLATDPILLIDVLYACIKTQADKNNISDEDFGTAFTGDELEPALRALIDEVASFFPEPKRTMLRRMISAANKYNEAEKAMIMKELEKNEIEKDLDLALQKLNEQFSNTQVSAE